jgi:hypothetical protein
MGIPFPTNDRGLVSYFGVAAHVALPENMQFAGNKSKPAFGAGAVAGVHHARAKTTETTDTRQVKFVVVLDAASLRMFSETSSPD